MATRTRRNWKPDPRGYYSRQMGWERSKTGKLQQHKFLLGTDRKEAERRERKLRELWDSFVASSKDDRPLWPDDLMVVAKRIAKGIPEIPIPRGPSEKQHEYAARIQRMQAKYPVVLFLPEDQHAYEIGQAALELFESIPHQEDVPIRMVDVDVAQALEDAKKRLAEVGITFSAELAVLSTPGNGNGQGEPLFGVMKPEDAPKLPQGSAPSHVEASHHTFPEYQQCARGSNVKNTDRDTVSCVRCVSEISQQGILPTGDCADFFVGADTGSSGQQSQEAPR